LAVLLEENHRATKEIDLLHLVFPNFGFFR
jgi:hypothetical protein